MKVLNIVETAYRATIEEQDDTILWLNTIFKNNGLDTTLLLRSNAVCYALSSQDTSGLKFGGLAQSHPTNIVDDVKRLIIKGVPIKAVKEDLEERGLTQASLIAGVEIIPKSEIPSLFETHDHIWHW